MNCVSGLYQNMFAESMAAGVFTFLDQGPEDEIPVMEAFLSPDAEAKTRAGKCEKPLKDNGHM